MKTSILASTLLLAFAQLQPTLALCKINGSNLGRCFAKSAEGASSFCSSFIAAPTPIVGDFDCVTKKTETSAPSTTSSSASTCSSVSISVSTVTSYVTAITSVSVSVITVTEVATASTVTITSACSSSSTSSAVPTPSGATANVTPFQDTSCGSPAGGGPAVTIVENTCFNISLKGAKVNSFTPGTYCSTDGSAAVCVIEYFYNADCTAKLDQRSANIPGSCLSMYYTSSMRLNCGCA